MFDQEKIPDVQKHSCLLLFVDGESCPFVFGWVPVPSAGEEVLAWGFIYFKIAKGRRVPKDGVILSRLNFCPFCGQFLEAQESRTKAAPEAEEKVPTDRSVAFVKDGEIVIEPEPEDGTP